MLRAGSERAAVAAGGRDAKQGRQLGRSGRSWTWPAAARVSVRALSSESAGSERGRLRRTGAECRIGRGERGRVASTLSLQAG